MKTPEERLKKAIKILRNDPLLLQCILEDALIRATDAGYLYASEIKKLAKLVDPAAAR